MPELVEPQPLSRSVTCSIDIQMTMPRKLRTRDKSRLLTLVVRIMGANLETQPRSGCLRSAQVLNPKP